MRAERKQIRAIHRAINRANAPGKEDRIAAAVAKRLRKNSKRSTQG